MAKNFKTATKSPYRATRRIDLGEEGVATAGQLVDLTDAEADELLAIGAIEAPPQTQQEAPKKD